MNYGEYLAHIRAGRVLGQKKICGCKIPYANEVVAEIAAKQHNVNRSMDHEVRAYPCAFCFKWHLGGPLPKKILYSIAGKKV